MAERVDTCERMKRSSVVQYHIRNVQSNRINQQRKRPIDYTNKINVQSGGMQAAYEKHVLLGGGTGARTGSIFRGTIISGKSGFLVSMLMST